MENFVIVIKKGTGYQIGKNRYSLASANKRKSEMEAVGIHCEVLTENEAFGV